MSELSERALYAGWYDQLEHILWHRAHAVGPSRFGHLQLDSVILARLKELSSAAGGWIHFPDDADEPAFIELRRWELLHAKWLERYPAEASRYDG